MKLSSPLPALLLLACIAPAAAETLMDLDASSIPPGEISETHNPIPGGRWQPNAPLRIEKIEGRSAFVFKGAEQLISELLPPVKREQFTVEAWVLNPTVERVETVAAMCGVKGGSGTEFAYASGASAGAFRSGFKATAPFVTIPTAGQWHHIAWSYDGGALRIYVDGEFETERPLKLNLPVPMKLHVGASGEGPSQGLHRRNLPAPPA